MQSREDKTKEEKKIKEKIDELNVTNKGFGLLFE